MDPLLVESLSNINLVSSYDSEDALDVDMLLAVGEGAVKKKKRRAKRGEDFKFHEAVVKADFWLLWLVYFCRVGSGATVLNKLALIGVCYGVDDTTKLLCLFSFCNFLGHLGAVSVSEHFVRSQNSMDNMDDNHTNNHDRNIPPLHVSSQRYPLCCDRIARDLLRLSVRNNDSNCFQAFQFETFWHSIQFLVARQPNWCTSFLCSSCWLCVRYRCSQATILSVLLTFWIKPVY